MQSVFGRPGVQRMSRPELMRNDRAASGPSLRDRTLYIPRMSFSAARCVAASFRSAGIDTHPFPPSDAETLELGGRYTSGEECFPERVTLGDVAADRPGARRAPREARLLHADRARALSLRAVRALPPQGARLGRRGGGDGLLPHQRNRLRQRGRQGGATGGLACAPRERPAPQGAPAGAAVRDGSAARAMRSTRRRCARPATSSRCPASPRRNRCGACAR